jgi:hypothetical protein
MISCVSVKRREPLEVERLGAGALAGWSPAGPAFVVYVVGRTSARGAVLDSLLL